MSKGAGFLAGAFIGIAALSFTSCWRMGESSIKLPANPVLSGGLGWGLVKNAYVRLKASPSESGRDLDHLRRGGVFALNARVFGPAANAASGSSASDSPTVWYGISSEGSNGWVRGAELEVFSSQAQAEKAASAYR
jgi:hypothetical protein